MRSPVPRTAPAILLLVACRTAQPAPAEEHCGVFHIVWGDRPRYFLAAGTGDLPLLLDETLTHPFGGPRALDRSRVCLTAARADSTLRVLTLSPVAP